MGPSFGKADWAWPPPSGRQLLLLRGIPADRGAVVQAGVSKQAQSPRGTPELFESNFFLSAVPRLACLAGEVEQYPAARGLFAPYAVSLLDAALAREYSQEPTRNAW
ncbi:hypothetical protein [Candidatus Methylacidithermus pantelleriae]|uniref:Uncharacterized protein n=1 Tax=Candidatus Methylacidithermus pantelleriae TaxID=2744239 RepID=A0A8J2BN19_9BACT|nr:hypothetical protein [Candidatus Methylacidithermus pantelleriae]CAF0700733.1 hypothetical protein MPNT_40015 [Candidatus Methylacidithermus pantelleriae]